ncbi:hypothetical protein [Methanocorpusculum labreanum]|uniref:hypothetical protein n=1 Tax=Methanocorpusculum labreanum TaxID=83984 RepID=UPI0003259098|nr:hypothetical protein [Methanocorpusculum labreanum]
MEPKLGGANTYLNQNNHTTYRQHLAEGSHRQYPEAQQGILAQIDYRDPSIQTLFSPLILGCIKEILEKGRDKT